MKKGIETYEISQFLGEVVDIFEDYLDNNNIHLKNKQRDEEDPDTGANIWGEDYSDLAYYIEYLLKDNVNLKTNKIETLNKINVDNAINDTYEIFLEIVSKSNSVSDVLIKKNKLNFMNAIRKLFTLWNIDII